MASCIAKPTVIARWTHARADDHRYDLRPRFVDQGRRDHDGGDAARRARAGPSQRSVATFVPGFERYGKGGITIRHLLTHESGLRPDVDSAIEWHGYDAAIELADRRGPDLRAGRAFRLQRHQLLPARRDRRARQRHAARPVHARRGFQPLGMTDTMFKPPATLRPRIAPTERCTPCGWPCNSPDSAPLRGIVHDPTARRMGGVAGHAGLFSTARDLSRFARMLSTAARLGGAHILVAADRRADDRAFDAGGDAQRARPGLGHRHVLLRQSRRTVADRLVRSHRLHRHVDLDRSASRAATSSSCRAACIRTAKVTSRRCARRVATVAAAALTDVPALPILMTGSRLAGGIGREVRPDSGATAPRPSCPSPPVLTGIDVLPRRRVRARCKGKRVGLSPITPGDRARRRDDDRCAARAPRT